MKIDRGGLLAFAYTASERVDAGVGFAAVG